MCKHKDSTKPESKADTEENLSSKLAHTLMLDEFRNMLSKEMKYNNKTQTHSDS